MFVHEKPELKQTPKNTVQKKDPAKMPAYLNNTGIPGDMKSLVETLSGFSLDDVRVHYNSDKPTQLQALAYTQGNQVYVAPGEERHLGHELGHVVQQKAGMVSPTRNEEGTAINDSPLLEKEADNISAPVQMKRKSQDNVVPLQTVKKVRPDKEAKEAWLNYKKIESVSVEKNL